MEHKCTKAKMKNMTFSALFDIYLELMAWYINLIFERSLSVKMKGYVCTVTSAKGYRLGQDLVLQSKQLETRKHCSRMRTTRLLIGRG